MQSQGKLQNAAQWAAILSSLVALGALAVAYFENASERRQERVVRWQETVVYSIIFERIAAGDSSVSFETIRSRYLESAQQYSELPNTEIQDDALRYVILGLIERGVIAPTRDGAYVLWSSFFVSPDASQELDDQRRHTEEIRSLAGRCHSLVKDHPKLYTESELFQKVSEESPVVKSDFDEAMLSIFFFITRDDSGKLSVLATTPLGPSSPPSN